MNAKKFQVREGATKKFGERLKDSAELPRLAPFLEDKLKRKDLELETRRRTEKLLAVVGSERLFTSPSTLPWFQIIGILESIRTPEARELLASIAAAPIGTLADRAREALARLGP